MEQPDAPIIGAFAVLLVSRIGALRREIDETFA
jgi:hypothetical protein